MRIAIVKLSALGDIVHAMVVLQFIKKFNKEILIDWFVEESYKELLEFHPHLNKVHIVNIKQAKKQKSLVILNKEFKKIRKLPRYDLVIDMQGLIKSAIISKLIPSKKTLGFDKLSARERFASIFYNKVFKFDYGSNIIERNLGIIEYALGVNVETEQIFNKSPFLYSKRKKLSVELEDLNKHIILIPGASSVESYSLKLPILQFIGKPILKLLNVSSSGTQSSSLVSSSSTKSGDIPSEIILLKILYSSSFNSCNV